MILKICKGDIIMARLMDKVARFNVSMSDEMLKRVHEFARENSISRTSAICVLVGQALDYRDSVKFANGLGELITRAEAVTSKK